MTFEKICWCLLPAVVVVVLILPLRTAAGTQPGTAQSNELQPAPSPVDNPLKGLVPYARPAPDRFPHSMEFMYLALSDLMKAENEFDWQPLDSLLDDIASRGNQAVIRIYLEYPGKNKGIPQYLIDQGLNVHRYVNTNTAPLPPTKVTTPDYEDPRLRSALQNFIRAMGQRYDGDARLAYITAGLLGTWGEWHTYPRNDLWASKETQNIVITAYESAFKTTPVLLRYPAGANHNTQAENATRPFGYHDDSFAWATLETGRPSDNWFYMPVLKAAGSKAIEKWKSQPIGGEIRPEVWGKIFDAPDHWPKQAQDFSECVAATHASWLMDTGMFREPPSPERLERATHAVRKMGYDLYIKSATFQIDGPNKNIQIKLNLVNRGVAPFYADWPTEIAFANSEGTLSSRQLAPRLSMRGHLPNSSGHELIETIAAPEMRGKYAVLIRVVNPLRGGKALRFANEEQDATVDGWLTLGQVELTD